MYRSRTAARDIIRDLKIDMFIAGFGGGVLFAGFLALFVR